MMLGSVRRKASGMQERLVSTITQILAEGGDQRTVFRGVDRHTYDQLSEAAGERQPVRLIYDGKDLEIMVIGNIHERYKELLAAIVRALTVGLDLDFVACGQTTWKTA